MKKIYLWCGAFTLAMILTGWYFVGVISDMMGYNILDPRRHFNLWEFVWTLIFAAAAVYSLRRVRKLQPARKTKRSAKNT